ncbi:type II toxin-antitoxin system PemI/MazE family antitoxin [Xylocopilactobacillus apicola]|uniref:AbrB family transcriptional regulator n=1 Tax=Xylocopilactobacillus apicola TaxID=2932184 RepID=A0AAU9DBA3_9LACO|nr:AbrB family transcriptional regulator [Xylocopilactobacillus apicola]BDR59696.1 AbrB family transcriptional regulator [Xylocopilactobacillus apicola]
MQKVKARKVGSSIVISLTKDLNVKEGQEFYLHKGADGYISLIPKVPDIYADATAEDLKDMDTDNIARDYRPRGSELSE